MQEKIKEIDYSKINIPIIPIEINNESEKINLRVFQCDLIENFDYFHPDLKKLVNVTKLRKRFLFREINENQKDEKNIDRKQYLEKYKDTFDTIKSESDQLIEDYNYNTIEF